ncbi:MAG: glycosyltransferase family 2 protein [Rhodopirellula sp.]|nr:glycosyltransferase family 2 protein [Rhodopirellula sp.]
MSSLKAIRHWLHPKPVETSIHLYALCWNEVRMLPHFFRHYDSIVDRYFIFDNGSTDGSIELLQQHPKVTLGEFHVTGRSFVEAARDFYDQCWKPSRQQADWVIVCNIDEHLYHPDLRRYLSTARQRGISLVVPRGFEMVSDTFPTGNEPLYRQVRTGTRLRKGGGLDKPELFAPDRIREINFENGRHRAAPEGIVRKPFCRKVKLLHYKYLGAGYLSGRLTELKQGLREHDVEQKLGHQYLWDEQRKLDEFQKVRRGAVQVV